MKAKIFAPENRKWWTLGAVAFGLFMIMLDNTIVNVALPSIQRDLGIGISELEWVVNGYALTFAVLMLTGGKLADLFGRRRIFIVGLVVFTVASLVCGLAASAGMLIGARAVAGRRRRAHEPGDARRSSRPPSRRASAAWRSASGPASRRWRSRSGPLVGGLITEHVELELDLLHQRPDRRSSRIVVGRLVIDESRDTSPSSGSTSPGS